METLKNVVESFISITKNPENYLCVQEKEAEKAKNVLKNLYDYLKREENSAVWQPSGTLPELIVDDLDEEQIWQELQLQNEGLCDNLVKDIANLLAKKSRLRFAVSLENGEDLSEEDEMSPVEEIPDIESENESVEENVVPKFRSALDDDFFKLSEMEEFCDEMEKPEKKLGVDLFMSDKESDEPELIRYNDFFGKAKKSVKFVDEDLDDEESEQEDEEIEDDGVKSSFQERQDRLKAKIESLEEKALEEKPWHLKGEVTSAGRPQNSLLEEYVEFDRAARPAPVFTEKTTLRLEDIIKQRIKDKSWDDVIRKIKPVEDVREFRKRLVLDQEKSKLSLAEIYEKEFIKQRDAASLLNTSEIVEDVEPIQHQEINKMLKVLFSKLDALSNFHYTPKQITPEVKIISNLPAITMEEIAPVGTSDATLLAPEEIKKKAKGELMSKEERTATDKKRERRSKKLKQRIRGQEKEKKEKLLKKMSLGLGNKYSKEKAEKAIEKLTKDKNVDRMVESQSKHLRSSSAFFNKLEDEVKGKITAKRNKKFVNKISAKKIKL